MAQPDVIVQEQKPGPEDLGATAQSVWELSLDGDAAFRRSMRDVKTKAAAYTMDATADRIILASGTTTITLPPAADADHTEYTVVRTGVATISVTTGGGTINGVNVIAVPLTLTTIYHSVTVASDGTNYYRTDNL